VRATTYQHCTSIPDVCAAQSAYFDRSSQYLSTTWLISKLDCHTRSVLLYFSLNDSLSAGQASICDAACRERIIGIVLLVRSTQSPTQASQTQYQHDHPKQILIIFNDWKMAEQKQEQHGCLKRFHYQVDSAHLGETRTKVLDSEFEDIVGHQFKSKKNRGSQPSRMHLIKSPTQRRPCTFLSPAQVPS